MRNGYLRETVDGRIYSINDGHQYEWNFSTGSWTVVPGTCELCDRNDDYRPEGTTVYIASNPNGEYRKLGGLKGIEWGPVADKDEIDPADEEAWRLANPNLKDISTNRTDTFTVTFEDVNNSMAEMMNNRRVRETVFDDRLKDTWIAPRGVWPKLSKRQMSRSVYTPQPEDPLFTSEEIARAAQDLGVELLPWQKDLLGRLPKNGQIMASFPRRNGRTNVAKVANKLAEWQGATANVGIYDELAETPWARYRRLYGSSDQNIWDAEMKTKAWAPSIDYAKQKYGISSQAAEYVKERKLSKKERIAELEETVEILIAEKMGLESDNTELDRIADFEHDRAIEAELKVEDQLAINRVLNQRITNQRTELRRLNKSLRWYSKMFDEERATRLRIQKNYEIKNALAKSKQQTIDSQQEIIDSQREQLAKKSWWRS